MNIFGEAVPVEVIIIIVASIAISLVSVWFALRFIKRSRAYSGDPAKKETASAFIESVRETGMYVNERPQLEFGLTTFPMNGPMQTKTMRQVISFVDLPNIQPGKYVEVSYETGTFKHLHIDGVKQFLQTGEPFDMSYLDDLTKKLSPGGAGQTTGTIISCQQTGTYIDAIPLFRLIVRFITPEGKSIEAETKRVCRPWLAEQLQPGNTAKVVYNKSNPEIFTLIE